MHLSDSELPVVAYIATGGTIASVTTEGSLGVVPTLTAEDLAASTPGLSGVAKVAAVQHSQLSSPSLDFTTLFALLDRARDAVSEGATGVVVSQGTDTIEETAYFFDLLWELDAPLIVTGAMRNPSSAGPDGPGNLLAAVQVAVSEEARGRGVLVVFADEIHAARFVHKAHASSLAAFGSPGRGPVGWVIEGRPVFHATTYRTPTLSPVTREIPPVVDLPVTLSDDGRLLPMLAGAGVAGLVIDAAGGGHVPARWMPVVKELLETMPVILSSRTGAGQVLRKTYDFVGSEIDLLQAGAVSGFALSAVKARILLGLLLAASVPRDELGEYFMNYGGR